MLFRSRGIKGSHGSIAAAGKETIREILASHHFHLPPLEFEPIVSHGRTFVNEANTTILDSYLLCFLCRVAKGLFLVQNGLAFAQHTGQNGDTACSSVAAVFHHADEGQGVFFIGDEPGEHGVGNLVFPQLGGAGLAADGEPREFPGAIGHLHVVTSLYVPFSRCSRTSPMQKMGVRPFSSARATFSRSVSAVSP